MNKYTGILLLAFSGSDFVNGNMLSGQKHFNPAVRRL
jgi:hypothetical protein